MHHPITRLIPIVVQQVKSHVHCVDSSRHRARERSWNSLCANGVAAIAQEVPSARVPKN